MPCSFQNSKIGQQSAPPHSFHFIPAQMHFNNALPPYLSLQNVGAGLGTSSLWKGAKITYHKSHHPGMDSLRPFCSQAPFSFFNAMKITPQQIVITVRLTLASRTWVSLHFPTHKIVMESKGIYLTGIWNVWNFKLKQIMCLSKIWQKRAVEIGKIFLHKRKYIFSVHPSNK